MKMENFIIKHHEMSKKCKKVQKKSCSERGLNPGRKIVEKIAIVRKIFFLIITPSFD